MKYEYRATLIDPQNKRFENIKYQIDAATWIEYVRGRPDEYGNGNLADVVESALPELEKGDYQLAGSLLRNIDEVMRKVNGNAVFELIMYFWHGFRPDVFLLKFGLLFSVTGGSVEAGAC